MIAMIPRNITKEARTFLIVRRLASGASFIIPVPQKPPVRSIKNFDPGFPGTYRDKRDA